jgi:hypothetical protein
MNKKIDNTPEELKRLLGGEFNQLTQPGKEESKTNFIQRYMYLCLPDKPRTMHLDDTMDTLIKDIDNEIEKTGYSRKEIYLEIQKYRHIIARNKNYGGFAGSNFPTAITMIGSFLVFFSPLVGLGLKDIIGFAPKLGIFSFSFLVLVALFVGLFKTFKSRKYEEMTSKYHDFLISYLIIKGLEE